jgi:hypothetical protein
MARVSPYRIQSAATIESLLGEARGLGLTGRELARHVSKGYPFRARKGYAYRVWLHEFEMRVKGVYRPFSLRARQRARRRGLLYSDQLWLFDQTRPRPEPVG